MKETPLQASWAGWDSTAAAEAKPEETWSVEAPAEWHDAGTSSSGEWRGFGGNLCT